MNTAPEQLVLKELPSVRGVFGFRHRGWIGIVLFAPIGTAVVFSAPRIDENSFWGLLLNTTGWLGFLSYATLRVWATLYVGGRKDNQLQTEGPYSLCRNPLYCGSFCFALAMACLLKSVYFGVALAFVFPLYLQLVVRAEEHFLELRFQEDYRNYCRRTPRFWPRLGGFHSPPRVEVNLQRLGKEAVRLGRAALMPICITAALHWRMSAWWPHWFTTF